MKTIKLPFEVKRPILACGADVKGAFALARDRKAWLFDGFGDIADIDNFERYARAVKAAIKKLRVSPKIVACDLHPDYSSSKFAEDFLLHPTPHTLHPKGAILLRIQHHEAHVAAVMADNAIRGDVIGVAFDGTGYGTDGNVWGGEFLVGRPASFKRAAHLGYVPMPGGEACIREPWRMAASCLHKARLGKAIRNKEWPAVKEAMNKGINSPLTSSAGRLFDAAASIILGRAKARLEAELPIRLEEITDPSVGGHYDFDIKAPGGPLVIDNRKVFKGIVKDILRKTDPAVVAGKFHNTMARVIRDTAVRLRKKRGIKDVVLSGGVFQNRFLTEKAFGMLHERGFRVHVRGVVPANDTGIPLGQISIANARVK